MELNFTVDLGNIILMGLVLAWLANLEMRTRSLELINARLRR